MPSERDRVLLDLSRYYQEAIRDLEVPNYTPWPPPPQMTPWPPEVELRGIRVATPDEAEYLADPGVLQGVWETSETWPEPFGRPRIPSIMARRHNADGTVDYRPVKPFDSLPSFPSELYWQDDGEWPIIVRKQGRRQD